MADLYNIVNISINSSKGVVFNDSVFDFSSWGCNTTQLSMINESNNLIPKISFIILLFAFLFLLFEFVVLPYFNEKSWYSYFVGLFSWFGTCLLFFGMWLLMPFAFSFKSMWQMFIPGLVLVVLVLVGMYFKRRHDAKELKKK